MSSKIEDEIVLATNFDPSWGLDREDFLKAIQRELEKLSNDEWVKLSEPAQDWSDDAARAVLAHQSIPEFPDWIEDEEVEAQAQEAAEGLAESEGEVRPKKSRRSRHAKTLPLKTRKALKNAVMSRVVKEYPLDRYGHIRISKASKAIAIFEKGATMRQVREWLGGSAHYNLLIHLQKHGHKVVHGPDHKITVIHRDDA
jgi:hypothetical protein